MANDPVAPGNWEARISSIASLHPVWRGCDCCPCGYMPSMLAALHFLGSAKVAVAASITLAAAVRFPMKENAGHALACAVQVNRTWPLPRLRPVAEGWSRAQAGETTAGQGLHVHRPVFHGHGQTLLANLHGVQRVPAKQVGQPAFRALT